MIVLGIFDVLLPIIGAWSMYFCRSVGARRFVFHFSVGPDLISPLKPMREIRILCAAVSSSRRAPAECYWSHSATRWKDPIARRRWHDVGQEAFDSSTRLGGHIILSWNFRRAIHCVLVHITARILLYSHFSDPCRSYLSNRFVVQTPRATIIIYYYIITSFYSRCHNDVNNNI